MYHTEAVNRMRIRIKKIHPKQLRFSMLQFLFWATFAAYYPFIVVILQNKGFDNTAIGTILSINSFIVVLAQPFWGMVSDWLQSIRKVFFICFTISIVLLQLVPFIQSALFIAILLAIVTIFESPLNPLLDSWVIQGIRTEESISYGTIRLWGSIGYAILCLILGKILDQASVNILFPALAIMGVCTIIMSTRIRVDKPVSKIPVKKLELGRLLKNYPYMTFLLFSVVIYIPHKAAASFLPNLIESVGGTSGNVGFACAIMAFAEVPVFLLSAKLLKRFKPTQLILTSSVFFMLRQLAYLNATTPLQVVLAQLLNGPSFALFLNGAVYYIDSLAPDKLKATAQTLATSLYVGISGIIGNYGGGWIIDNLRLTTLYYIGIYITVGITLVFLASFPIGKMIEKNKQVNSL